MVSTRKELSESSLYCNKKKKTGEGFDFCFNTSNISNESFFNYMDIYHYDLISDMRHTYALYVRFIYVYIINKFMRWII